MNRRGGRKRSKFLVDKRFFRFWEDEDFRLFRLTNLSLGGQPGTVAEIC